MALWVPSEKLSVTHKDCWKGTHVLYLRLHSKRKSHCEECCKLHIAAAFGLRSFTWQCSMCLSRKYKSTKSLGLVPPGAIRGNMTNDIQLPGTSNGVTEEVLHNFPVFPRRAGLWVPRVVTGLSHTLLVASFLSCLFSPSPPFYSYPEPCLKVRHMETQTRSRVDPKTVTASQLGW